MKKHVTYTKDILNSKMDYEIVELAYRHHEKLDGSGYIKGVDAKDLSFEDRLLACIDIYQALIEKRSYKGNFEHDNSINIMRDMAKDNKIDGKIVEDINNYYRGRK